MGRETAFSVAGGEVAGYLVPLAEAGELETEARMTGILAQHSTELGVTVASFKRDAGGGWLDRLHVEVASTAFPGYARNLGTLEPIATGETIVVATNRILHDAEHPSHVLLPVVPREGAPELSFER